MKRKMIVVVLLVLVCLGALVVEGVTQPPEQGTAPTPVDFSPRRSMPTPPPPPPPTVSTSNPTQNFSVVQSQQQEWTFEQLVEALKAVRARQKDLQAQEADLLAKMETKIQEKREDLSKSEATLQQLRGVNGRFYPSRGDKMMGSDKMGMDKVKEDKIR